MTEQPISYPHGAHQTYFNLEDSSFWFSHRANVVAALLKQYPPAGEMYDVGGGNGYMSKRLQDSGISCVLVEPGEQGVSNAKLRGVKQVEQGVIQDERFKNATLPAVGLFDVLEHIENDEQFLKDIYQKLRPGGYLYITVPAFQWCWSEEDAAAGHYRRYNIGQLRRRLEEQGYEICYTSYFFFLLLLPVFLFRAIPYKLGFRKTNAIPEADHQTTGLIKGLVDRLFTLELRWLKCGGLFFAGGSCLVVARKPKR